MKKQTGDDGFFPKLDIREDTVEIQPFIIKRKIKNPKETYHENGKDMYRILYFEMENKLIGIRDFLKAHLIDPQKYAEHQLDNQQLCMVVSEHAVNEKWPTKRGKKTDYQIYVYCVEILELLYDKLFNLDNQKTKKRFRSIIEPKEST